MFLIDLTTPEGMRTLEELAQEPQLDPTQWGLKTLGLAKLMSRRNLGYEVPPGFVIPVAGAEVEEIIQGVDYLTENQTEDIMLVARSSAPDESPGKYESQPFLWGASDPKLNYARALEAYRFVIGDVPKAVIFQQVVGESLAYKGNATFGLSNTSFVAQLPSFNPDEMAITAARGTAEGVVGSDSSNVFLIDYNFVTGDLARIIDLDEEAFANKELVGKPRQKTATFYDLKAGSLRTVDVPLSPSNIRIRRYAHGADPAVNGGINQSKAPKRFLPFHSLSEIHHLGEVVKELGQGKPIELEGAYLCGTLYLFQHRELDEVPYTHIVFTSGKRIVAEAGTVMGTGRYTLDLLMASISSSVAFHNILNAKGNRRYALMANRWVGQFGTEILENLAVMCDRGPLNPRSHEASSVRRLIASGDMDLCLGRFREDPFYFNDRVRRPDQVWGSGLTQVRMYRGATFESDGKTAQVFFENDDPTLAYDISGIYITTNPADINSDPDREILLKHPEMDIAIHIIPTIGNGRVIVNGIWVGEVRPYDRMTYTDKPWAQVFDELIVQYTPDQLKN